MEKFEMAKTLLAGSRLMPTTGYPPPPPKRRRGLSALTEGVPTSAATGAASAEDNRLRNIAAEGPPRRDATVPRARGTYHLPLILAQLTRVGSLPPHQRRAAAEPIG